MTLKVEVNVMVDDVKWNPGFSWYTGKFIFQQIAPLDPIVVAKNGDINLKKAKVTEDIEVTYNWLSNAVEIDGELYPVIVADPPADSFWVLPGNGKPKSSDLPPAGNDDITVDDGTGKKTLVMKDKNTPSKHYTFCFALRVGIDDGQWLVADPKIVNTGTNRLYSYQSSEQSN